MINNSVVMRDDVPEKLARQVARLRDALHANEEGKAMLARMHVSRFELAGGKCFRVMAGSLRKFGKTVHPIGLPK
jgi:phosphonate transport system substrate-binding protein